MDEQAIAMVFAGFAVLATFVTWTFYIVAGKSLWDIRKLLGRTPGDHGGHTDQRHT